MFDQCFGVQNFSVSLPSALQPGIFNGVIEYNKSSGYYSGLQDQQAPKDNGRLLGRSSTPD